MTTVEKVLVQPASYEEDAMNRAVERVFEGVPLEVRGRTVLIKPNMAAQCRVEKAATTHPALIRAVVRALKRRNAARVLVGDNPGATAYGANEKCARTTGILDAAGDCYLNLMQRPRDVEIGSAFLDRVNISSEFLECDLVVNLPKLKGHAHAFMTGAVKNLYGMCVGGEKSRLHVLGKNPRTFAEILVDVYCARVPDLHIMDSVIGMEGNGPTNGTPRSVGVLAASTNGFALDAVCARMIGYNIDRIQTLAVGRDRGLWSGSVDDVAIEGSVPRVKRFKPPFTFGAYAIFSQTMSPFISCLPKIRTDRCKKCGVCASHCPVGSCRSEKDEFPRIDKKKCIRCYCCQEFCPHDAIALTGTMFRLTRLMAGVPREG